MRSVFVGGGFAALAALIATWAILGVGKGGNDTTCPLPAYPNAACTGVPSGTSLTTTTGNMDLSTPNQVIDAQDLHGCFVVRAAGVTIKNSQAECIVIINDAAAKGAARLKVQDSTLNCKASGGSETGEFTGVRFNNFDLNRVDISDCENAISASRDFSVRNSYIHDLYQCSVADCAQPDPPHSDGIESGDGSDGLIEHNSIFIVNMPCSVPSHGTCNGTSSININSSSGSCPSCAKTTNLAIINNLLRGGSYSIYCPIHANQPAPQNFYIIDNHFSNSFSSTIGENGISNGCADGDEIVAGNVVQETGNPIALT